jgi:GNAT superfamily N-acetyltransferase
MAGDWIKIEHTTPDKPEVIRMAEMLRLDRDAVAGKLFRLWAWADQNSVDGADVMVTATFIDDLARRRGFAAALIAVGWLHSEGGALHFPNFGRHNGETAKARAMTNRRVSKSRSRGNANVTERPLQKPLPEKRREEKSIDLADSPSQTARGREPEGWPSTEVAAKSQASAMGVDPEYAAAVWNEHDSSGDFTRRSENGERIPILKWPGYLKARWTYRQQRGHEARAMEKHKAELRGQGQRTAASPNTRDERGQRPNEIRTDVTADKIPRI